MQPYPRGFLISREPCEPPPAFNPGPRLPNFHIAADTEVEVASTASADVVILGSCVPVQPMATGPAEHLLAALHQGEDAMLGALDAFCGRHVVLYRAAGRGVRLVTDATGMRSTFYAAEGGVVASHAMAVERALGNRIVKSRFPYGYGFPGNHTPYAATRLLTPNTLYDLDTHRVIRFWPREPLPSLDVAEAAERVGSMTLHALRTLGAKRDLTLSITAGIDSRTVLALASAAGVAFDSYTYDRGPSTRIDCLVARELAARAGCAHTVVDARSLDVPADLQSALNRATYYNHHHNVAPPMRRFLEGRDATAVSANLLEIGRYFYQSSRRDGRNRPVDGAGMAALHQASFTAGARAAVERFGAEAYREASTALFEEFAAVTDFSAARGLIDPYDQFYWEHRMAAWHGMILLERDFYADSFIPFNARAVFAALLGVSADQRRASTVFHRLIETHAPQLLAGLPINPKVWPPAG